MFSFRTFNVNNVINKSIFVNRLTLGRANMGKSKQKAKGKPQSSGGATVTEPVREESAIQTNAKGQIAVKVLAKPGASRNAVTDLTPEGVGVQIAAPPVDGEANSELVKYFLKLLGVRKSDVFLDKGSKSRHKVLIVTGTTVEAIKQTVEREIATDG